MQKVAVFRELYEPARKFITDHDLGSRAELEFAAALRERDLEVRFWDYVKRNVVGSFTGADEGATRLRELIASTEFDDPDSVISFVIDLDEALHKDLRADPPIDIDVRSVVRSGHSVGEIYDLVWGLTYLEPHYHLQSQGVPIDQLSPGEKGTLLLMFYLLLDPSGRPLLLDQPDENLDNQTIKELLVPAIKEAKRRRQVIVITHNPNVAVVADADQVVEANFDGYEFSYNAGAIELPQMNLAVVDVLEGTWPAFQTRESKYQSPPSMQ